MSNTYKFTRVVTTDYFFDIEADSEDNAWDLVGKMDNDECDAQKEVDTTDELTKTIEEESEEDEEMVNDSIKEEPLNG